MARRMVELQFPIAGLDRRAAFPKQPPFSTPEAVNVRGRSISGRARGGSRPGTIKAWSTGLGGGEPVRLLASVETNVSSSAKAFVDPFDGSSLSDDWSTPPWMAGPLTVGGGYANSPQSGEYGALLDDQNVDGAQPHSASIRIPTAIETVGNYTSHSIYGGMDDFSPNGSQNSVVAVISRQRRPGSYYGALYLFQFVSGSLFLNLYTELDSTDSTFHSGTLSISFASGICRVQWAGDNGNTIYLQHPVTVAGTRYAIGMDRFVASLNYSRIDSFRLDYYSALSIAPFQLVASAGGNVYYLDENNSLEHHSGNATLASDRVLCSAERLGELFIADVSDVVAQGDKGDAFSKGTISGVSHDSLDSPAYSDWTELAINKDDYVVEITAASNPSIVLGMYKIATIASGSLTLATGAGADGDVSFRILRGPKVWKASTASLTPYTATTGSVPVGCHAIACYRDRIILAGDGTPGFYASRQGDPYDFNYGASDLDPARAYSGVLSTAGGTGVPIHAVVAFADDFLVFGCRNELWVMLGDITSGGVIVNRSREIGILSRTAWCRLPDGTMVFLSAGGLYAIAPGSGGFPVRVSDAIPRELLGVDPLSTTITMAYDLYDQGIHIYLTPDSTSFRPTHWFLDWNMKSFWPVQFGHYIFDPTALLAFRKIGSGSHSDVLLGCRDGYIRRYSDGASTDDGMPILSNVMIGPLRPGGSMAQDGNLTEMIANLTRDSGSVNWALYVGETPEDAVRSSARQVGTWSGGHNRRVRPRVRGNAIYLQLQSGTSWELEELMVSMQPAGQRR